MKVVIVLILFIALTISTKPYCKSKFKNRDYDKLVFNDPTHYVFELQLPQTLCLFKECKLEYTRNFSGDTFTVHGLWPSISYQPFYDQPQCCQPHFEQASSLMQEQIAEESRSFYIGLFSDTDGFWDYEYWKHGTCTPQAQKLSQTDSVNYFFNTINELFLKHPLHSVLKEKGIVPNNNQWYSLDEIETALNTGFDGDYNVVVKCYQDSNNQFILQGVQLFFDENFNLIPQPQFTQTLEQGIQDQIVEYMPKLRGSQQNVHQVDCQRDKGILYPENNFVYEI